MWLKHVLNQLILKNKLCNVFFPQSINFIRILHHLLIFTSLRLQLETCLYSQMLFLVLCNISKQQFTDLCLCHYIAPLAINSIKIYHEQGCLEQTCQCTESFSLGLTSYCVKWKKAHNGVLTTDQQNLKRNRQGSTRQFAKHSDAKTFFQQSISLFYQKKKTYAGVWALVSLRQLSASPVRLAILVKVNGKFTVVSSHNPRYAVLGFSFKPLPSSQHMQNKGCHSLWGKFEWNLRAFFPPLRLAKQCPCSQNWKGLYSRPLFHLPSLFLSCLL